MKIISFLIYYAIYENALYKFTAAKTAGAWDAAKVQAVTVAGEINSLNENLSAVNIADKLAYNNAAFELATAEKIGNMVHISGTILQKTAVGITIAKGYRPKYRHLISYCNYSEWAFDKQCFLVMRVEAGSDQILFDLTNAPYQYAYVDIVYAI